MSRGTSKLSVKFHSLSNTSMAFTMQGLPQSVSNALRRVLLAEIPSLAIDIVELEQNSSPLFDEFLAHRIGLIPIDSSKVNSFSFGRDCTCTSNCPNCTVYYSLDVNNTNSDEPITVSHMDLIPMTGNTPKPLSSLNSIPITKLSKNQALKGTLLGKKGVPKMHAKYQVVNVSMWYKPRVVIDRDIEHDLDIEFRSEFVKSCPRNVFELDDSDQIVVRRESDCILCDECVVLCKESSEDATTNNNKSNTNGLVRVFEDEDITEWELEGNHSRLVSDILIEGIKILNNKWNQLYTDLEDWEREVGI
jgi:DNA-directed RNA polymerase II subunit RPB3